MAREITLSLPEETYNEFAQIAVLESRDIADVIGDHLVRTQPNQTRDEQRRLMRKEIAAYHKLHPELVKTHFGKTVAVHGGLLVDYDDDPIALLQRIRKNYPNHVVLQRKVDAMPEQELHFRSLRYVI
jgi:hypothetical protein